MLSSYFEGNISANLVQPQKLFWRASQRQTRSRCCRQSCRIWAVEAKWQGLHRYHTESKTTTLLPIIREQVKPDSIVYTDCYRSYDVLEVSEFSHLRINYSTHFAERQNHINGIENFWGLCKVRLSKFRGILKHNFYSHIKECEFRYNCRNKNLYLIF